jgi:hypothetical protein
VRQIENEQGAIPPQADVRPGATPPAARLLWAAGLLLAAVGLFTLYVRQSRIAPFNADGGSTMLQAQAMLHGNVLLRGWWTADASFYTTELPEYMIVEALRGLRPDVVHICGAISYTLTVLLAALLARGSATGLAGLVRALIAAGIMLAPGIGGGTQVFLQEPNHAGTAVPILLTFLLLDRAPERWYVPVAVCLLLAWTQVGDALTMVSAAAAITAVAVVRLGVLRLRRRPRAEFGYDAALLAAAVAAVPLARGGQALIQALGGFALLPLPRPLFAAPSRIPGNARMMGQTLLLLFGANNPGTARGSLDALMYFHLIGLVLAGLALPAAIVTFFTRLDRVSQVVVAATLATLAAGIFSTELPGLSHAHEVAILLPFGAVLAGRVLAGRVLPGLLPAGRGTFLALLPPLGAWLAASLAALCWAATWVPIAPQNAALAAWLAGHGYAEGLAAYWQANSTTVDTGGKVLVVPVSDGGTAVRHWETSAGWYDPATRRADFVVAMANPDGPRGGLRAGSEREFFGRPAHVYHMGPYVIMVYRYNLLSRLNGRAFGSPEPPG